MRRLTKSRNNVVLTGTLAGIGEYTGIDPTIIRVLFAILMLFSCGTVTFVYILLAVVIPTDVNAKQSYGHDNPYNRNVKRPNPYARNQEPRKPAEKIDDDDEWSDF